MGCVENQAPDRERRRTNKSTEDTADQLSLSGILGTGVSFAHNGANPDSNSDTDQAGQQNGASTQPSLVLNGHFVDFANLDPRDGAGIDQATAAVCRSVETKFRVGSRNQFPVNGVPRIDDNVQRRSWLCPLDCFPIAKVFGGGRQAPKSHNSEQADD